MPKRRTTSTAAASEKNNKDLVSDGGFESYFRLRPRTRENSGKWVTGSHKLRVGSWNIGSLTGKSIDLVKIFKKRKINIACVQKTRWVGSKARDVNGFKLWYSGGSRDRNGVGIVVDGDLREQVVEVRRISDSGLGRGGQKTLYEDLDEVVRGIPNTKKIVIGGDFNGHIGATSSGFDYVYEGFGFGERNGSGTSLLDFAKAFELVIANSCFPKKENHMVTFRSSVAKTQIDYLLFRKGDRCLCKDCKVIPSENLTTQHKLLVMDLEIKRDKKKKIVFDLPRIKWGGLTPALSREMGEKLMGIGAWSGSGDVDTTWNKAASCIREVASKVLGKIPPKLKGKFYGVVVRPALLYGAECWPVKNSHVQKMHVMEMRMLRWMCGHTRSDKIRNEFGHVRRRCADTSVRRCEGLAIEGTRRGRGRPKKFWGEVIR
ncbi:hypothetical protein H5410_005142 [Solanum commersonii]|uniref:Craniofacial development protein 2-like n=1 Tax=Solanum commersonii TaxID=4109 RepID=A0A9J6A6S2_SOLCO|nr:hypothetical protein H5410_005142 [Solanum commersonii]